jgi:hypothetical protein
MMSDKTELSEKNPALNEKPKRENYGAVKDNEKCTVSGEL